MKTSHFQKVLSVFLCLALIWTSGNAAEVAALAPDVLAAVTLPPQLKLAPPPSLGRVADYYNAPATGNPNHPITDSPTHRPLIVLIQDLHAHYGAQKNIAGILDFLDKRLQKNPPLVPPLSKGGAGGFPPFALAVEGASGPIDSSVMALFPDQKIKQSAADYLMREGELTGMEYFAVMKGLPNLLVGVEDSRYYNLHRDLFRKTLADRQELVGLLKGIDADIKPLENRFYGPSLQSFQKTLQAYDKGELSHEDLLAYLIQRGAALHVDWKSDFPELARYAMTLGQGDKGVPGLPTPEQLRSATAEFLTHAQGYFSVDERQILVSLAKKSSTTDYYLYLRDLVYKHQLFLAAPVELSRYLEFVHVSESMGMDHVLHDVQELAFRLEMQTANDGPEKDLVQVEHDLTLLIRMADLQSTQMEVKSFGPRTNQFVALCKSLMESNGIRTFDETKVRALISSSIDYYAMALMRNEPMMDNTLALLGQQVSDEASKRVRDGHQNSSPTYSPTRSLAHSPSVAVLVTGGFHTEPLTELLRQRNISYVVITPTVDELSEADQDLYIKRLSGNLLTVEDVLANAGKGSTPAVARLWPFSKIPSPLAGEGEGEGKSLAVGLFGATVAGVAFAALYATWAHAGGMPADFSHISQFLGHYPAWGQHLPQAITAMTMVPKLPNKGRPSTNPTQPLNPSSQSPAERAAQILRDAGYRLTDIGHWQAVIENSYPGSKVYYGSRDNDLDKRIGEKLISNGITVTRLSSREIVTAFENLPDITPAEKVENLLDRTPDLARLMMLLARWDEGQKTWGDILAKDAAPLAPSEITPDMARRALATWSSQAGNLYIYLGQLITKNKIQGAPLLVFESAKTQALLKEFANSKPAVLHADVNKTIEDFRANGQVSRLSFFERLHAAWLIARAGEWTIGLRLALGFYSVRLYGDQDTAELVAGQTSHAGISTGAIHLAMGEYLQLKSRGPLSVAGRIAHEAKEIARWRQEARRRRQNRRTMRGWIKGHLPEARQLDRQIHREGLTLERRISGDDSVGTFAVSEDPHDINIQAHESDSPTFLTRASELLKHELQRRNIDNFTPNAEELERIAAPLRAGDQNKALSWANTIAERAQRAQWAIQRQWKGQIDSTALRAIMEAQLQFAKVQYGQDEAAKTAARTQLANALQEIAERQQAKQPDEILSRAFSEAGLNPSVFLNKVQSEQRDKIRDALKNEGADVAARMAKDIVKAVGEKDQASYTISATVQAPQRLKPVTPAQVRAVVAWFENNQGRGSAYDRARIREMQNSGQAGANYLFKRLYETIGPGMYGTYDHKKASKLIWDLQMDANRLHSAAHTDLAREITKMMRDVGLGDPLTINEILSSVPQQSLTQQSTYKWGRRFLVLLHLFPTLQLVFYPIRSWSWQLPEAGTPEGDRWVEQNFAPRWLPEIWNLTVRAEAFAREHGYQGNPTPEQRQQILQTRVEGARDIQKGTLITATLTTAASIIALLGLIALGQHEPSLFSGLTVRWLVGSMMTLWFLIPMTVNAHYHGVHNVDHSGDGAALSWGEDEPREPPDPTLTVVRLLRPQSHIEISTTDQRIRIAIEGRVQEFSSNLGLKIIISQNDKIYTTNSPFAAAAIEIQYVPARGWQVRDLRDRVRFTESRPVGSTWTSLSYTSAEIDQLNLDEVSQIRFGQNVYGNEDKGQKITAIMDSQGRILGIREFSYPQTAHSYEVHQFSLVYHPSSAGGGDLKILKGTGAAPLDEKLIDAFKQMGFDVTPENPTPQEPAPPQPKPIEIGGQKKGGELAAKFSGDLWIEAGGFAYLLKPNQSNILFQRYDRVQGHALGHPHWIDYGEVLSVGREVGSYVLPTDGLLSSRHFHLNIIRNGGSILLLYLADLKSTNGTTIKGSDLIPIDLNFEPEDPEINQPEADVPATATGVTEPLAKETFNEFARGEEKVIDADVDRALLARERTVGVHELGADRPVSAIRARVKEVLRRRNGSSMQLEVQSVGRSVWFNTVSEAAPPRLRKEDNPERYAAVLKTLSIALETLFNPRSQHWLIRDRESKFLNSPSLMSTPPFEYHDFKPVSPMEVLGEWGAELPPEVQTFFLENGAARLREYVDADVIRDIVNKLGGKHGETDLMELLRSYLVDVYEFETTNDRSQLKEALTRLLQRTYKFSKAIQYGRVKFFSRTRGRWLFDEEQVIGQLSPANSTFQIVPPETADTPEAFINYVQTRGQSHQFYIFNQLYEWNNRLFALVAREGRLELYYTSETYSLVAGQYQWQRQEAILSHLDGGRLQGYWFAKPAVESAHELSAAASQEINRLVAQGLETQKVQIQRSNFKNRSVVMDLHLDLGLAFDSSGVAMSRDARRQPQKGNPMGLEIDRERYPNWPRDINPDQPPKFGSEAIDYLSTSDKLANAAGHPVNSRQNHPPTGGPGAKLGNWGLPVMVGAGLVLVGLGWGLPAFFQLLAALAAISLTYIGVVLLIKAIFGTLPAWLQQIIRHRIIPRQPAENTQPGAVSGSEFDASNPPPNPSPAQPSPGRLGDEPRSDVRSGPPAETERQSIDTTGHALQERFTPLLQRLASPRELDEVNADLEALLDQLHSQKDVVELAQNPLLVSSLNGLYAYRQYMLTHYLQTMLDRDRLTSMPREEQYEAAGRHIQTIRNFEKLSATHVSLLLHKVLDDPSARSALLTTLGLNRSGTGPSVRMTFAKGSESELTSRFPEVLGWLEDETKASAFVTLLSAFRMLSNGDSLFDQEADESALEYAIRTGQYFALADGLFVTSVSESFKRHVVFRMNQDKQILDAIEVMIPGEARKDRVYLPTHRFEVSEDLRHFPGARDGIIPVLAMLEYPQLHTMTAYGETLAATPNAPFRIFVYDQAHDLQGRRFTNSIDSPQLTQAYLDRIARDVQSGLHPGGQVPTPESIVRDVLHIINEFIKQGYYFANDTGNDIHIGNFKLCLNGRVRFVGDFDAFWKKDAIDPNRTLRNFEMRGAISHWLQKYLGDTLDMSGVNYDSLIDEIMRENNPSPSENTAHPPARGADDFGPGSPFSGRVRRPLDKQDEDVPRLPMHHDDSQSRPSVQPPAESQTPENLFIRLPVHYAALVGTLPDAKAEIPENFVDKVDDPRDDELILVYRNNGFLSKIQRWHWSPNAVREFLKDRGLPAFKDTVGHLLDVLFRNPELFKDDPDAQKHAEFENEYDYSRRPELLYILYQGKQIPFESFKSNWHQLFADDLKLMDAAPFSYSGEYLYRALRLHEWEDLKEKGYLALRPRDNFQSMVGSQVSSYVKNPEYAGVIIRFLRQGPYYAEAGMSVRIVRVVIPHFITENDIEVSENGEEGTWQSLKDLRKQLKSAQPGDEESMGARSSSLKEQEGGPPADGGAADSIFHGIAAQFPQISDPWARRIGMAGLLVEIPSLLLFAATHGPVLTGLLLLGFLTAHVLLQIRQYRIRGYIGEGQTGLWLRDHGWQIAQQLLVFLPYLIYSLLPIIVEPSQMSFFTTALAAAVPITIHVVYDWFQLLKTTSPMLPRLQQHELANLTNLDKKKVDEISILQAQEEAAQLRERKTGFNAEFKNLQKEVENETDAKVAAKIVWSFMDNRPPAQMSASELMQIFNLFKERGAWSDMIKLYDASKDRSFRYSPITRESLAVALNNIQDFKRSEHVIRELNRQFGPSGETAAILGEVYRKRYEMLKEKGKEKAALAALEKSVEILEAGFRQDFELAPGMDLLHNLMTLAAESKDPRRQAQLHALADRVAEMIPVSIRLVGGFRSNDARTLAALVEISTLLPLHWQLIRPAIAAWAEAPGVDWNREKPMVAHLEKFRDQLSRLPRRESTARQIHDINSTLEILKDPKPPSDLAPLINKKTRAIFNEAYDFGLFNSNFVGGNVTFGGQSHDHVVNRWDMLQARAELKRQGLNMTTDVQQFDVGINRIIRKQFGTVDLEDLHSPQHGDYDAFMLGQLDIAAANDRAEDTRTNIMIDYLMGRGDCREHAISKAVFFGVWKADNVKHRLRQAYDAAKKGNGADFSSWLEAADTMSRRHLLIFDSVVQAPFIMLKKYNPQMHGTNIPMMDASGQYNEVEDHTWTAYIEEDDGGNIKRFVRDDSFYQNEYQFGGRTPDGRQGYEVPLDKISESGVIDGGFRKAWEGDKDNGKPVMAPVRLVRTRYAGDRKTRVRPNNDEYGQVRLRGLSIIAGRQSDIVNLADPAVREVMTRYQERVRLESRSALLKALETDGFNVKSLTGQAEKVVNFMKQNHIPMTDKNAVAFLKVLDLDPQTAAGVRELVKQAQQSGAQEEPRKQTAAMNAWEAFRLGEWGLMLRLLFFRGNMISVNHYLQFVPSIELVLRQFAQSEIAKEGAAGVDLSKLDIHVEMDTTMSRGQGASVTRVYNDQGQLTGLTFRINAHLDAETMKWAAVHEMMHVLVGPQLMADQKQGWIESLVTFFFRSLGISEEERLVTRATRQFMSNRPGMMTQAVRAAGGAVHQADLSGRPLAEADVHDPVMDDLVTTLPAAADSAAIRANLRHQRQTIFTGRAFGGAA